MVKIYETINDVRLVVEVEINGSMQTITFSGGRLYPTRKAGTYRTDDISVQCALEADSAYEKDFKLKETIEVTKDTIKYLSVTEVTNRQSAIEWLRCNLGIRFTITTRTSTIIERAQENGYVFVNWKTK